MDKYKAKPSDNPDYKINKPDERTRNEQLMLLIHMFTFIGAPQIWNGEEMGMWGADDPDCRKPLVWEDLIFEDERTAFDPAKSRPVDTVKPDTALKSFYVRLCAMRKANPVLVYGDLKFSLADDKKMVLAYERTMGNDAIVVAFNRSDSTMIVTVPVKKDGEYEDLLSGRKELLRSINKEISVTLKPVTEIVLKKKL